MARDTLRLVTLGDGGRPVPVLDLNDADGYWRDRDGGFAYTPSAVSQHVSRRARRFAGGRVVGEIHDNGSIAWTAYVRGATPQACGERVEQLIELINATASGRYLEWAPDGLPSSFLEIAGPGAWTPVYDPLQLSQGSGMRVQLSFPVYPLVRWAPMTIGDYFEVDSRADYAFDAAASSDISFFLNEWSPVGAAMTSERRARHTARGYLHKEGQATLGAVPGSTLTGHKTAVTLRASASSYAEVYVDDNGTNSRLRIDVVIGGVRTNRASVNLAARIADGSSYYVRGRIEGLTVYAEYFTSSPAPMGTPTLSASYTLSGGEDAGLTGGYSGWSWVPQHASARLFRFTFEPFTYRNLTLPQLIAPLDEIPGSAPALAEVEITTSGGADNPAWALVGWLGAPVDPGVTDVPLGVYEAESLSKVGLTSSSQAGARGGFDARLTASGGAAWSVVLGMQDSQYAEADEFSDGQIDVEVWARVLVSSTLVNPRVTASYGDLTFGTMPQYTAEFGSAGRALVKPSSGAVYRFTRLGTLAIDLAGGPLITLAGTCDVGSTGVFGADYVLVAPARRRALGVTGVPMTSVRDFAPSTTAWTKRIRSDLSAVAGASAITLKRDRGLGGSMIEPSPGGTRWLVKLSNLVPDDPTVNTNAEQLSHSGTVRIAVTPRSYLLRSA